MCFADKHTKSTEPGVKGYHRKKELKTKKKHKQINKKKQNKTTQKLLSEIVSVYSKLSVDSTVH